MEYNQKSRPLPEMLDGKDWEVRNSENLKVAYVDFKKKQFVVPFDEGPAGELVRAHEAMHVKITSRNIDMSGADFTTFQAVEDARVHQGLRLCGIRTQGGRVYDSSELSVAFKNAALLGHGISMRLAEAYFAVKGCDEEVDIIRLIGEHSPEILPVCEELYSEYFTVNESAGNLTSEEKAIECTRELRKRIKEEKPEEEKEPGESRDYTKNGKNRTASFQPGKPDESLFDQELPAMTSTEAKEAREAFDSTRHGSKDPGEMRVETAKFDSQIHFKKVRSVRMTPSDEGVIPSRMYRYASDMKVFSSKGKRRAGAAVLIDVSGSMGLSQNDVMSILKQCPASIVAVYSGYRDGGILRIIAEKNRFYSKLNYNMPGANVVDIPALQWLAKRPEKKKLWICDGLITGKNDGGLKAQYVRQAVKIVREAKIERVGKVKDLISSGVLIDKAFDDGNSIADRNEAKVTSSGYKEF